MLQQQQQQQVKQKEQWRCDVCRIVTFATYQDACDHEEQCKLNIKTTSNDDNEAFVADVVVVSSSSNSSSSFEPCSSSQDLCNTEGSINIFNRLRKKPEMFEPATSVASTRSIKSKRLQPKLSTSSGRKEAQPSPSSSEKPKRKLQDVIVSIIISNDDPQVLAAQVPCATSPTIRTTKSKKRIQEVISLDTTSSVIKNKKEGNAKVKRSKNTASASKPFAVQKDVKNRPNKRIERTTTANAHLSSHSNALIDWLAVSIPEEEEHEIIIQDDNEDTTIKETHTKFLTEQMVAYKFREERRKKQQLEREKQFRQKARQEQESSLKITTIIDLDTKNSDTKIPCDTSLLRRPTIQSKTNQNSTTSSVTIHSIRFPTSSHIIAESNNMISYRGIKAQLCQQQQQCWWNQTSTTIHQMQKSQSKSVSSISMKWKNADDVIVNDPRNGAFDLLSMAIQRYLVPSPVIETNHLPRCSTGTLWVDRYYNTTTPSPNDYPKPNDCATYFNGNTQRKVYEKLSSFIERFMLERHKVERTVIEKRNKRKQKFFDLSSPPSKSKKNRPTIQREVQRSTRDDSSDDDFLWDDDDDDDYSNSNGAFNAESCSSSLCVLSGPIGSGKSNLVHHVAKQLGCRKVVELHTGIKRNSASMKRIIEEATKSHSTFDMLQNQQQQNKSQTYTKVDNRKDSINGYHEGDDENTDIRGSAVTVILIDEVDNLDPCTDTGFWSTLCELYKESKCPIILTCNTIPRELCSASSFRYTHIPVKCPTPIECSEQLNDILAREGFLVRPNYISDTLCNNGNDPMTTIAELGNCDMRRILHELKLFQVRTLSPFVLPLQQPTITRDMKPHRITVLDTNISSYHPPKIESIHPNIVYLDRYTSMTITGTNFSSLIDPTNHKDTDFLDARRCDVYIGDYRCPHCCIINETTIIAVVAPLRRFCSVDQRSAIHLPVNIICAERLGLLSTTRNSIVTIDLPDHTKIIGTTSPYLIECRLEDFAATVESDSENEFDCIPTTYGMVSTTPNGSACRITPVPTKDIDASQLLQTSVDEWVMRNGKIHDIPVTDTAYKVTSEELQVLDDMWLQSNLASDATLFEDVGLNSVPILSGACRGFGFTYTDDFPKRTNENSKPYVSLYLNFIRPLRPSMMKLIYLISLSFKSVRGTIGTFGMERQFKLLRCR
jgi:IPT/TIG domain/ATPase family associated with various cellular activities (AAA)